MTITLSNPIATGRTAEVHAWGEHQVLKLYYDWCPAHWVEEEARVAKAVSAAGIPTPQAFDILEVDGRHGLVYERIDGISMLRDMNARPWRMLRHARWLADLQVKVHQMSISGLPSYKQRLAYDINNVKYLSDDLKQKTLATLESLPDGDRLCHGDYHPDNVLITKDGPVIIDWMTACSGSPWVDVARSSMILSVGPKGAGKRLGAMIRLAVMLFHRTYLNHYRAQVHDVNHELKRWRPVIAAARLIEEIVPEREALIERVQEG